MLLSAADRWFVAASLHNLPWIGGEAVVTGFYTIHEALKLNEIQLSRNFDQQPRSTTPYTLSAPIVNLMIRILCGEMGGGFNGASGLATAKLVIRLRTQVTRALAHKKT